MRPINEELRKEILKAISEGARPADLAQKHGIVVGNIYNWMHREKVKAATDSKPEVLKKPSKPGSKPKSIRTGGTGLALASLDQQINALMVNFQKDMKSLLIKQVAQTLNSI